MERKPLVAELDIQDTEEAVTIRLPADPLVKEGGAMTRQVAGEATMGEFQECVTVQV